MKAIKFENFTAFYKNKKDYIKALCDINLEIDEGELIVVVGESGCGKTTLIKSCLGMAEYFEGDLFVDGVTIEDIDLKTGRFAYVKQEFALYPNLTVYENIAFPLRVMKTSQKEVDKRVKEMAALLDIPYLLTRKPRQLSIGQQQRVAIARALIKNPAFIFFDEPFANVDPAFRSELRELVRKIHSEMRPTIVFVTHDLPEAFSLADRLVVLEEGRIVEIGDIDKICAEPASDLMKTFLSQNNSMIQ